MEYELTYPFRFKPLKHNLDIIRHELAYYKNTSTEVDYFISIIKELNNNYIDIYSGNLTPFEIIDQINKFLITENVLLHSTFIDWLGAEGFKKVVINDGSHWILRESLSDKNYIHIHPARFTPHSERIYGSAFKTALLLIVLHLEKHKQDVDLINELRKKYLNLSPLKSISIENKISKALHLIISK